MSHKREVWDTVSNFISSQREAGGDGLAKLEKEVGKLGREQYRANTLAQAQAERLEAALESLQSVLAQQEAARQEAVHKARLEVLKSLLPLLDGLEASLRSGGRHAYRLHQQGLPEAETLIAWLDGVRLLRDRLLAILAEGGIKPIPTVGRPFDPYRHVAVETVEDESRPDGQIVAEEHRGYAAGDQVLRYAQVVVVRNRPRET
jgi:molecular chaperone GrpE